MPIVTGPAGTLVWQVPFFLSRCGLTGTAGRLPVEGCTSSPSSTFLEIRTSPSNFDNWEAVPPLLCKDFLWATGITIVFSIVFSETEFTCVVVVVVVVVMVRSHVKMLCFQPF
jgi:hypothetical protein